MSDTATLEPPATPPASTPPSVFASGLEFAPDWFKTALPEEFHGLAKDAKSLPDVFARLKGSRDELASRGSGLRVPGEKATDEERATFQKELYKLAGVPEKPEEYELAPPEGMEADTDLIAAVAKLGPEIGLSKAAASKLAEAYNQHILGRAEKIRAEETAAVEADRKALATELGDKADSSIALAKEAAKRNGWPEETMDPTNEAFVGASAFKLVLGLAQELAKATGSDRTGQGQGTGGSQAKDWDWAVRVQKGTEPESEYIKDRSHPKYAETWAAIEAAGKAKFPGQR